MAPDRAGGSPAVGQPSLLNWKILLGSLALLALACQAAVRVSQGGSWRPLSPTPVTPSASPSLTFTPLPSLTPTPAETPTPIPSPSPEPTATLQPTPAPVHFDVFQDLWQIINEEYLYPDFNGVDWEAVRREFYLRVESGLTDEEFYAAMDEMLFRLGDDHSFYLSPDQAADEEAEYRGDLEYVGIGVLVVSIPDRQRAVVILTFPDSPAERAGIQPRDSILAVEGAPILSEDGFLRDVIRGPAGTAVQLTVQSPGQEPRLITLLRERIASITPLPFQLLDSPGGRRIGYILLPTFSDQTIVDQFARAIESMSASDPLHGLIVDNRWNGGGTDTVLRGTLRYFTDGILGYFVNREGQRPLLVNGVDLNGSQQLPMVVLVGPDTVSFGEIFAGILRDRDRAYLIGETTEGNVETLWGYDFSDGSRAWIAHDSFFPVSDPTQDWETNGVSPDLEVKAAWEDYPLEQDPLVLAGLQYLDDSLE